MQTIRGEIGKRIRHARELAKLRVVELAYALDVLPITVYRWQSGTTQPSLDMLTRIAAVCRVSFAWLVTGEGNARAAA